MHEENGRLVFEDATGLLDLPLPRLPGRHQHLQRRHRDRGAARGRARHCRARAFERGLLERGMAGAAAAAAQAAGWSILRPARAELWLDGGHNDDGGRVLAEAMADFEERVAAPAGADLRHLEHQGHRRLPAPFQRPRPRVLAVPIPGEHAARPAEEVAAFAQRRRLERRGLSERRGRAALSCGAPLGGAAADPHRGVAVPRRPGARGERDLAALRRPRSRPTRPDPGRACNDRRSSRSAAWRDLFGSAPSRSRRAR